MHASVQSTTHCDAGQVQYPMRCRSGHAQYGMPVQSNSSLHDAPSLPLLLVLLVVPLEDPPEDDVVDPPVEDVLELDPVLGPSPFVVVVQATSKRSAPTRRVDFIPGRLPC